MLDRTKDTSITISGLENGSTHGYIVQPISYVEIADNVFAENRVSATCGQAEYDIKIFAYMDINRYFVLESIAPLGNKCTPSVKF
mgnify:CR=1 FL=1